MAIETEWRDYDVIVVGSGGSGSIAAHAAAESGANVLVVSKDPIGCSDTKISEGAVTVRQTGDDTDSETTLSENVKLAGGDLPLQSITDAFAEDSKRAYDTYREHGLRPSIDASGNKPKAMPLPLGGHTKRRTVGHANNGVAFGHAGWQAMIQNNRIDYLEDAWFLEVVTETASNKKTVVGGLIYDASRGKLVAVRAPSVIIAAGGLSTLYFPKTDTMRGNTGDSYAVAARAGADLVDMEQVQFLPFCLTSPPSFEGLLCGEPVTASYLGVLRDKHGKVILDGIYLRTRAECSAAIMRAVEDGRGSPNGGAYLDMTANMKQPRSGPYFYRFLQTCLPSCLQNARQALGKKAGKVEEPWEVRPGAHYSMGGLRADAHGASVAGEGDGKRADGVTGLFAAGQAMGGVFGANRLGSTSLTENAVFGNRAGHAAAEHARDANPRGDDAPFRAMIDKVASRFGQKGTVAASKLKLQLQKECWECIGPIRTADKLARMNELLSKWTRQLDEVVVPSYTTWNQAFIEFEELRNMLDTAKAVQMAAVERDASLGGHVRLDKGSISSFSQPYSTVVRRAQNATWQVERASREGTPISRIISYKVQDTWRKLQAKALRMMPSTIQDKVLEKRYKAIMGAGGAAPEVQPGSAEAAIGDTA